MKWQDIGDLGCPIARTLSVVGDRWTVLILRNAFMRMRRFDEFQASLDIPKHILSVRLKKLVEAEVLKRVPYQDSPTRYEYRLTEQGKQLHPLILLMADWGNKWMNDGHGPLMSFTHTDCGQPFHPVITCSECGEPVLPQKIGMGPLPDMKTVTNAVKTR